MLSDGGFGLDLFKSKRKRRNPRTAARRRCSRVIERRAASSASAGPCVPSPLRRAWEGRGMSGAQGRGAGGGVADIVKGEFLLKDGGFGTLVRSQAAEGGGALLRVARQADAGARKVTERPPALGAPPSVERGSESLGVVVGVGAVVIEDAPDAPPWCACASTSKSERGNSESPRWTSRCWRRRGSTSAGRTIMGRRLYARCGTATTTTKSARCSALLRAAGATN